jgi:hypothetical protein
MGKVITSNGLPEFIEKGTVTHIPDHKPSKEAPPLEVKKDPPIVDIGEKVAEKPLEVDPKLEKQIESEETVPTLSEDSRKYVNKQHRLRKEAEEEAALSESLAREQFNRATLAEEKARALEAELSQLKKPPETKVEEPKFPLAQDFVKDNKFDQDAYQKAVTDYNKAETKRLLDNERQEREVAQIRAKVEASWDVARKAHPDFDEVRAKVEGTPADMVPQFVREYIVDSDLSGEVAYYLWTHADETQRIAGLSPIRGIAELGKIQAKLATAEQKAPIVEVKPERPGAPPPITPISTAGAGTVNTDPAKMSFAELRAYRKEERRKK